MGLKVFDYNGDGTLDLFVTDMHSDMFGKSLAPEDWAGEMRNFAPRAHNQTLPRSAAGRRTMAGGRSWVRSRAARR